MQMTQLYVLLKPGVNDLSSIMSCPSDIKCWMPNNILQFHNSKTEIIIITPPGLCNTTPYFMTSTGSLTTNIKEEA
ncbi:hypothetical protein LDENG_00026550 [Lucifuga dentata]|nr:hypothetical protein LDENG_00026550 [Lucifuga dentata]